MWMWRDIDIEFLGQRGIPFPENLQKDIEGMSFNETAEYFKIYFGSWDPRNSGTQYFYFDNLKLIYRDR
jgi:hypothetical protein